MDLVQTIKVKIFDREYLIKSEEDIGQVQKIEKYVNEKLKEIKDKSDDLSEKKTAILAALIIAGEYFQVLKERDAMLTDIQKRTKALIYDIDAVMR